MALIRIENTQACDITLAINLDGNISAVTIPFARLGEDGQRVNGVQMVDESFLEVAMKNTAIKGWFQKGELLRGEADTIDESEEDQVVRRRRKE